MKRLLNSLPPKRKLAAMLSLSFTICFTVFFFVPFDLFLNNPTDFIISWKFLFLPLVTASLVCFFAFSAVFLMIFRQKLILGIAIILAFGLMIVCLRFAFSSFRSIYRYIYPLTAALLLLWIVLIKVFKKNAIDVVLLIAWGAIACAYIQMLFLNRDMALITGDSAGYGLLTTANIINIAIWVIITLVPLCLWLLFKAKGKDIKYDTALVITMILISGMQIAGLVSSAVTTELPPGYDEGTLSYLSYEPILDLSADDNIIVFILDRLDVSIMSEVLNEYPELFDQLDGFTFFMNNVSEYGSTFPTVTKMLTQYYYDYDAGMTFNEYWKKAWAQETIIDILRKNGYTINLCLDTLSTYGDITEIQHRVDNIKYDAELSVSYDGMLNMISRLSLGRLAPYVIKNFFLATLDPAFGDKFYTIKTGNNSVVARSSVSINSDMDFYRYISSNELSERSSKRVFDFIHLNCSHIGLDISTTTYGYHYDQTRGTIGLGGNYLQTTRACFEILNIYFENMKKTGVYDNSTIILVGDHGATTIAATSLLLKPQDATGSLLIDSKTELSNKYFGASILEAAGIPHETQGLSYFDIINGTPPPVRYVFDHNSWWAARRDSNAVAPKGTYEIPSDASDFDNWIYTSK